MWQYSEAQLSRPEISKIVKQLTIAIGEHVGGAAPCNFRQNASTQNINAFGRYMGHLILPRFFPMNVLPTTTPMFRWKSLSCNLPADTRQFSGVLHSEPPQCKAGATIASHLSAPLSGHTPQDRWNGMVVSLRPGFGRIATALWAASKIGVHTVIVTHSEDRARRWREGVDVFFNKVETRHEHFVVVEANELCRDLGDAAAHSSARGQMTELPESLRRAGLLVVDDANRIPLDSYARFINLWDVPRVLGIIASESFDHRIVKWSLGAIMYKSGAVWSSMSHANHHSRQCDDAQPEENQEPPEKSTVAIETPRHRVSNMYHVSKERLTADCNGDVRAAAALIEEMKTTLRMEPTTYGGGDSSGSAFNAYVDNADGWFSVPRFCGVEKFGLGPNVEIDVDHGVAMSSAVKFSGQLKTDNPPQQHCHDITIETMHASPTSGTLLNLYCGAGKTVLAIAIAATLGRRTLILVHTDDLLEQWIRRISSYAPDAVIGRIQQKTCRVQGCDFVVGMLQSIASRDYPECDMRSFGLCVVDECHRIACRWFSSALAKISAPHILGLSATAYRKDGTDRLMFWSCGPIRMSVARKHETVEVIMLRFNTSVKPIPQRGGRSKHNRALMLNYLATEEARNKIICAHLTKYFATGRATMLLSERKSQVKIIRKSLEANESVFGSDFGEHTGDVGPKEREEALSKRIILATYHKAREGLDVPELDTLILATPVSDVEQAVGRILRKKDGKKKPLVIDLWDQVDPFIGSGFTRRRYYKSQGYNVRDVDI